MRTKEAIIIFTESSRQISHIEEAIVNVTSSQKSSTDMTNKARK